MKTKLIRGNVTVSLEEQEIALSLLQAIAFDNGFFNRCSPERYDAKWINNIGSISKVFFDANPDFLTDYDIEEICCGEESEVIEKYRELTRFKALHKALNEYFNNH